VFDGFVERARSTFASSPDQGDGLTMQSPKHFVNGFVVIILVDYILCSADTQRSVRDYKVSVYGGQTSMAFGIHSPTVALNTCEPLPSQRLNSMAGEAWRH
jgi:hypothetical protein